MTERGWKHGLVAMPGIGVSLLPKLMCPLCWPDPVGRGLCVILSDEKVASSLSRYGVGPCLRSCSRSLESRADIAVPSSAKLRM